MSREVPIFVKPTNPYFLLIEIYSGRQVLAGEIVDGIPIGPGVQAQTLDLKGTYLQGGFLAFSDFSGSNLDDVNLQAGSISYGDFSDVSFRNALLSITSFAQADLAGADLRAAQMLLMDNSNVDLQGADLSGAEVIGGTFEFGNLRNANFSESIIQNTGFQFSDLRGTNFEGVVLSGCTFYGAKFDRETFKGAIFDETIMPDGTVRSTSKRPTKEVFFGAKDSVLELDPESAVYTAALQEQTSGRFAYGTRLRRLAVGLWYQCTWTQSLWAQPQ